MHFISITSKKSWPKNVTSVIIYSPSCRTKPAWPTLPCNTKPDSQADLQPNHLQKRWKNGDWDCHSAIFFWAPQKKVSHRSLERHRVSKWWQNPHFWANLFFFTSLASLTESWENILLISPRLFSPNASVYFQPCIRLWQGLQSKVTYFSMR